MRTPALPLCLALIVGIIAGILGSCRLAPLPGFAVATVALASSLGCAVRHRALSGSLCVVVAFAVLGNVASTLHTQAVERSELLQVYQRFGERVFSSARLTTGRLRREPEPRVDATLMSIDVETIVIGRRDVEARGGLRVSVRGEKRAALETLVTGDRVRLWVVVREPAFFSNPGGFDGARYLEQQHIDLLGSVKSGLLVNRVASTPKLSALVSRLRRWVLQRLVFELRSPDTFGIVAALVTGDRAGLSPELTRLYQRAGIFHIMAISGAHVAIWIAFLYGMLRWMGLSARATLVLLMLALPLYAVFCGSRAPVVRAVLMALLLMGARLRSLRAPAENALAVAALALLAWEPASLFDAGFQLTMTAMATIVVFYERIARWLAPLGFLAKPLAVSLAAQLGVMPIAAWHFHRLNTGAPVASLVAIPVAAAICVLGVALVIVSGTPVVAAIVSASTRLAVAVLTGVAELAAELPAASIRVGAPSWIFVGVYVGALIALLSTSKRVRASGGLLLGALFVVALFPLRPSSGVLEISALDVGHGDAILLTLPGGGNVLVDGGGIPFGTLDVGESVLLPFLLDRGVRRLDAIVVTHTDFDHIGGLTTVVNELRVDAIWQGAPDIERRAYRELRERADERNVPVVTLTAGENFQLDGAYFEVLAAGEGTLARSNNRSIVLRVGYGGRHVLLTGDAEDELERRLVRSGMDLRADVLKLAHHGSRSSTSSAFLDAVQPQFAIVSARRNRSRPIPSALVLHRLRQRGIEYARTDRNGTITVKFHQDGQMEISTYRQSK